MWIILNPELVLHIRKKNQIQYYVGTKSKAKCSKKEVYEINWIASTNALVLSNSIEIQVTSFMRVCAPSMRMEAYVQNEKYEQKIKRCNP